MRKILFLLVSLWLFPVISAFGQTDVLTQHNDTMRTGQNITETILSPSNVNAAGFGKLFSLPVDGHVYAQPLYKANVSIAGGSHNVIYVATEGDSVYAFDADGASAALWHVSLIDAAHGVTGETTGNLTNDIGASCTDLVPQVGITSTPVIDPTTGTMYVEAKSKRTADGKYVQRLHMLDITTGAEKSPGPQVITATVPGTSDGGTTVTFDPLFEHNRPGLLLVNGNVYLGYASHCDQPPYHGWIFAYNASTLAQAGVYLTTPNGLLPNGQHERGGGIWMAGTGIAADSTGNIFAAVANGVFDATDVGDSILKLAQSGNTISLTDYFTPFDQGADDFNDYDVGSGGVLLLPDQPGAHPHELVEGTKSGAIYLIDRDHMTTNNQHYCSGCSSDPEIVQELLNVGVPEWLFAAPAYWNNTVYIWGSNDVLKAYTLSNGLLGRAPSSSSTHSFGFPGATPSISANGTTNGIVWAIDSTTPFGSGSPANPAVLHAYDATNVANELWNSSQAANNRDTAGKAVKFTVPTIANGKVYIDTQTELVVYGLLGSNPQQVATPTFSPAAGTYTAAQLQSGVSISDTTTGALIYYTTGGSTPTTSSTQYSGPIAVGSTTTIKAIAAASGMTNSAVATATYTIQSSGGGGSPSYGSGFTSAGLTLNGKAAINGTRLRLTDGGSGEASSAFFNTPVNVQSFTNDFSFQLASATADGFTFTIQGNSPNALGPVGGGLGYGPSHPGGTPGIGKSVAVKFDLYSNAGEGGDSTGSYTNGVSPTIPSQDMTSSGVDLHSGDVMNVHMIYDGTTLTWTITDPTAGTSFTTSAAVNIPSLVGGTTAYVGFTGGTGGLTAIQDILSWTYVASGGSPQQVATPTFSPAAGTYTAAQLQSGVSISDTTTGALIYYTTGGSTPTTSSTQYSGPIAVGSTTTIKAIAAASGMTNSTVATATYTIQSSGGGGSPSYGSGFTSAGLTLNGKAAINGTRLRLTDGGSGEASSAFFNTPVSVQSFTNDFSFQLASATADGFTFTIQGNSPTALGVGGGSLGYGPNNSGTPGIGKSVAVKFDLFSNAGEGSDSTGSYTNGVSPTIPSQDMTSSGVDLHSGDVMNVHMIYDGTTLTWTITDPTAGTSFTTSAAVNIPSLVGGTTAYVGFTGGTGGLTAIQDVLSWTYVASGGSPQQVATPTFSPAAGTYTAAQLQSGVSISDTTTGALIYYTTGGSTPTTSSTQYSGPIAVGSTTTIKAIAAASGMTNSTVATATYTIQSSGGGGSPSYGSGFTSAGLTLNGKAAINGTRLRLTDGGSGEASSAFFNTPVSVQSFTNDFSFQLASATADGFTFTIQGNSPTALGVGGGSLGYGPNNSGTPGIGKSVAVKFDLFSNAGEGSDSTGSYTNGALPTIPSQDMTSSGVDLHSGDVMNVHMIYDGTTLTWTITDPTLGTSFTTSAAVNIPSLVGGTTAYVGFTGGTGGLTAIQDVLSWTYVASGGSPQQVATPTFSPAAGTYTAAQLQSGVSISDTTTGALIYYTTGGSTPTTSSTQYSGPIAVGSTTTIKAIAAASGMTNSAVATATYTIQSSGGGGSPSYGSGFTSAGLTLNGKAAINGTRLRLTDGGSGEASSAFFNTPVNVQSFTNDFSFQLASATADGFTFTIQGNSPTALGVGGGSLGYGPNNSGTPGIGKSVAVKFDLFSNAGEGSDSTGSYTNGALPTIPSQDMTSSGVDLHSGDVMNVHMIYDGTTLTWTITDPTLGTSFTTSAAVNIPSLVGGTTAYVGFTGGTGGLTAIQDILSWTY